jgi:hypothetical protein
MASPARADKLMTLAQFLRLPEIDEHPYLEYINGRNGSIAPEVS